MADLIDRGALYKEVEAWEAAAMEAVKKATDVEERKRWGYILQERTAFKHDVADAPAVLPEQKTWRWIPVTERLPEPPSFCLVTTDGSHNDVIDIALFMSDGWHKASTILAWMPLPGAYKGGNDG